MTELIVVATTELAAFLLRELPSMSSDWWRTLVVERLSFQQQRVLHERNHTSLQQLDLAALLRVLDQNWYDLQPRLNLSRDGRNWVKELQSVRNRWAHLSGNAISAADLYRDSDTLARVLTMIGAAPSSLDAVESFKADHLARMVGGATKARTGEAPAASAPGANVMSSPAAAAKFAVGQIVALRSEPALGMPVVEVVFGSPEYRYRVFINNSKATFYESQLLAFSDGRPERTALAVGEFQARLTSLRLLSPSTATLFSMRSGRVQFVPYQYRPVLKLIRSDRPRLLIADEVGVGKTIEAGLIIRELRARMDIASVLVICPKALVAERKWVTELKRFDEEFIDLDGSQLRHCLRETHLEGQWPDHYAKAVVPFSLFDSDLVFGRSGKGNRGDKGLLALDPPPKFDLVIVDEAHHLRNSETFLHQGVRYFCDHAHAVLLLTATPVQLGSNDLFTLLNVLRPDLIIDRASFAQMAEPNQHINEAVRLCRGAESGWQLSAVAALAKASETEWGRLFLRESADFQDVFDRLGGETLPDRERVETTKDLEDLYTFSALINRTRRRDIGDFTTRKPETVRVEFTPAQRALHDTLLAVVARILVRCHGQVNVKFLMTTIRRQAASCLYGLVPLMSAILGGKLDRLELMESNDTDDDVDLSGIGHIRADVESVLHQARQLDRNDPKVEAFKKVLRDKSQRANNKALVFSTFRHTLAYLFEHATSTGLRVALVHGDVPDEERAHLRRRFALPKDDANAVDVMLSSEVGCEGLDFQFCDLIINYDLPWNPMRIEQRIGRIDRYGQTSEVVAVVNLVTPGTVDADIYDRCLWRIGVFQHAIGGSEEILGTITQELHDVAESFDLSTDERAARLQQLADNGIRHLREEADLETQQAELFGLNIPTRSWREEIKAAESAWLSPAAIQRCVSSYLTRRVGRDVEHVLGDKPVKTLRLSNDARALMLEDYKHLPSTNDPVSRGWEKWLKGSQPTLALTFEQSAASENPQVVHMSIVHPLVRQAARALEITDPEHVSLAISGSGLKPGDHHFALYRWALHGVKPDEMVVAVAHDPGVEQALLRLLEVGADQGLRPVLDEAACEALDERHYAKWTEMQASHIAANRQTVEHRIQSLTVSHRARRKAIEDQLGRATNDKIRVMKESELARAEGDFNRRLADLQSAAELGDVRATAIVFGTISVKGQD